jgi:hypothetical protein
VATLMLKLLSTIGIILTVIGIVLELMGMAGHTMAGRRYYY